MTSPQAGSSCSVPPRNERRSGQIRGQAFELAHGGPASAIVGNQGRHDGPAAACFGSDRIDSCRRSSGGGHILTAQLG